jgi:hypothetical protein
VPSEVLEYHIVMELQAAKAATGVSSPP